MRRPNFFILGAGRCGTTTLYHMLRQHKDIFMPKVKEPSFFCSYFQVVENPVKYFQLFNKCKNESMVGEASHMYFSNPETPEILYTLFPDAKFILILRNPTNRAYSLYNWARRRGVEHLKTFGEAIEIEDKRYKNPKFLKNCPHYFWNFMYTKSSYYDIQLRRYLKFYDEDRFCIINLFEFSKDPHHWFRYICEFLGVDTSFNPTFKYHNKGNYKTINPEMKSLLDRKFEKTILETERIAGKNLYLDKL